MADIEKLQKMLDEKRFAHSVEVAKLAKELATKFGEDPEKAYTAGILHDCAKNMSVGKSKMLCTRLKVKLDKIESKNPALIHAPLGAELAKKEFGVSDKDIYNAIKYHTVGRAGMSKLEKIIYVADMAEPLRKYNGVEDLRKALETDLDDAVLIALKLSVKHNLGRDKLVHASTIDAWNDIKLSKGE